MKKRILAASILFCTAATITSCNNGAYDANPDTNFSSTGNPLKDTTQNGGGGGGSNSKFDWTGTDPLSAKVNGTAFQATTGSANSSSGFFIISGSQGIDGTISFSIPESTGAGSTFTLTSSNSATYTENFTDVYSSALGGGGAVKVLENDATHIKGLFYFSGKSPSGVTKTITEGYFNVTK